MRHSASDSATYSQDLSQDKNGGNLYSDNILPVALLHCTRTRLYKTVHYKKKSILTMENLHNKSLNNLCGVVDAHP